MDALFNNLLGFVCSFLILTDMSLSQARFIASQTLNIVDASEGLVATLVQKDPVNGQKVAAKYQNAKSAALQQADFFNGKILPAFNSNLAEKHIPGFLKSNMQMRTMGGHPDYVNKIAFTFQQACNLNEGMADVLEEQANNLILIRNSNIFFNPAFDMKLLDTAVDENIEALKMGQDHSNQLVELKKQLLLNPGTKIDYSGVDAFQFLTHVDYINALGGPPDYKEKSFPLWDLLNQPYKHIINPNTVALQQEIARLDNLERENQTYMGMVNPTVFTLQQEIARLEAEKRENEHLQKSKKAKRNARERANYKNKNKNMTVEQREQKRAYERSLYKKKPIEKKNKR